MKNAKLNQLYTIQVILNLERIFMWQALSFTNVHHK
jgi:hypothetical protein